MTEDVKPYGAKVDDGATRTNEMRALLVELGFSQRQAADVLGVDQRTVRYWAAADPPPPVMALYALRYLLLNGMGAGGPLTPEQIAEANRTGGHAAVDRLVQAHNQRVAEDSDDELERGS